MKIAMCTDAFMPRINGVAISVDTCSRQLAAQGHEILVICPQYIETEDDFAFYFTDCQTSYNDKEFPYRIFRVPSQRLIFSKEDRLARLEKWFSVKQCLDAFKPDIIHLHSEFFIGYFGLTYAKYRKVPLIYTFHTLWEEYVDGYIPVYYGAGLIKILSRKLICFYLKNADSIITPTKRIESVVRGYGIKSPVSLLPTGIPDMFTRRNAEDDARYAKQFFERYPALYGKKILLFVGRVAKEKNIDFLLDVTESLAASIPDVCLLIVGGGPYLETLQKTVQKRGLQHNTVFTGYADRADLPHIYRLSTVFVFASKTETQGLVTLEAMLCRTPVVAIGEKGTIDIMQGDNGGYMVPDDSAVFTEKVRLLLSDSALYNAKKAEAERWAQAWTIESITRCLLELYAATVKAKKEQKEFPQENTPNGSVLLP